MAVLARIFGGDINANENEQESNNMWQGLEDSASG
jgi:hypothetical protein